LVQGPSIKRRLWLFGLGRLLIPAFLMMF